MVTSNEIEKAAAAADGGDGDAPQQGNNNINNGSFSKGFDHRENDFLPVSPTPRSSRLLSFNNSGGQLSYNNNNDPSSSPGDGHPPGAAAAGGGNGIELALTPGGGVGGLPGDLDLLANLVEPDIEDDTEAAEALRANANVKVGKVGKVARSVNAQT
ncbi:MAG: hypothetical protein SGARI_002057, partial [Bacillariaceae sp.]